MKLSAADTAIVLAGLADASVVTQASNAQIFNVLGPASLAALAGKLGLQSGSTLATKQALSSGVTFISKPSQLHVPPWQMVSASAFASWLGLAFFASRC